MAANQDFVKQLAQRYNASYEQGDVDKLDEYGRGAIKYRELQNDPNANWDQPGISSPQQFEDFKTALEAQYKQRGANSNGPAGGDSRSDGGTPPPTGTSGTASSPAQAWNTAPIAPFPSWYRGLMEQQVASQQQAQAETKARADGLYSTLSARAGQSLNVTPNDPIIKGQVDAYRGEQDRAARNYVSDVAEQAGPYGNIQGERRIAAERVGQGVGGFQAELLGRELTARRDEIAQALATEGALLSGDQQRALTGQLATLDQAIRQAGVVQQGQQLALQSSLGFGDLALRDKLGTGQLALGNRQADITQLLGLGNLGLGYYGANTTRRGQNLSNDQFLRELALRQWDLGDQSDYRWAQLGA